jgi:hypothetical protein
VKIQKQIYWEGDKQFTRTFYVTPVGTVTVLEQAGGFTSWVHEKMLKSPDDYKAILFLIQDERHEPNHEAFARAERAFGEDGIYRGQIGLEPLQALISGHYIDMQDFCIEWMERRDEVLKLYRAMVENHRKIYKLIAESSALITNYGGNVTPEIIGLETFEKYYVPHYNEAAEVFHKHGKLIGCHFDANCKLLAKAIAGTELDYIEAFTPSPTTDMTLAEARAAWPNKVIWLNFPCSIHLSPDAEVEAKAYELVSEVKSPDGIIVGITEDVPSHRWQDSCRAIMDGLERHARENPQLYR